MAVQTTTSASDSPRSTANRSAVPGHGVAEGGHHDERDDGEQAEGRRGDRPSESAPAFECEHELTAHLSQRQEIYTLPLPFTGREEAGADWSAAEMATRADGFDWVALDLVDRTAEFPQVSERLPPILQALGFDEILRRGSVVVYRRGQPSTS